MQTLEINASTLGVLTQLFAGIAMTAVSLLIAVPLLPGIEPGSFVRFIGWIGVVFFAPLTLLAIHRVVSRRGPVVTLSPDGLLDRRISAKPIPWSAISKITTLTIQHQDMMVVDLDPEIESQLDLELTRVARWARPANQTIGVDGLSIAVADLDITTDELLAQTLSFMERYADAVPDRIEMLSEDGGVSQRDLR